MILICIKWDAFWSFWINVLVNLIAIGAFCVLVLLIWKCLCWLDSWQWGKKRHQKENLNIWNEVQKEFQDDLATILQAIKERDNNPELSWEKNTALKGELKIIRELTDMCFNPEEIEKIVDEKVVVKLMVNYSNFYSLLQNIVPAKSKETLPKEDDIQQSHISLLMEHENLSKDIKNPPKGKEKEELIKEWISNNKTKKLQDELNGFIDIIDNCIEDCLKNNNNGQTQQ